MSFDRWLDIYSSLSSSNSRVVLLSYLERKQVSHPRLVSSNIQHSDIINNIIKRVYGSL
jgi:hypothetical protein